MPVKFGLGKLRGSANVQNPQFGSLLGLEIVPMQCAECGEETTGLRVGLGVVEAFFWVQQH